jgi:F0F1-type ATP synthase epsilon subunit
VDGREGYAAVDGGVLLVEGDHVSIVTREAVVAHSLQAIADAAAAMVGSRRKEEELARVSAEQIALRLLQELREVRPRS